MTWQGKIASTIFEFISLVSVVVCHTVTVVVKAEQILVDMDLIIEVTLCQNRSVAEG